MDVNSAMVAAEEIKGKVPSYLLHGSGKLLLAIAFLLDHLHNASVWAGKKAISKASLDGQKSEVDVRESTCHTEKKREPVVSRERIDNVSEVSPKAESETTITQDEQRSTDSSPDSTGEETPLNTSAEVELTEQVSTH